MTRALVFDVIETLLDLLPLREAFGRVFGDAPPAGEWVRRVIARRFH